MITLPISFLILKAIIGLSNDISIVSEYFLKDDENQEYTYISPLVKYPIFSSTTVHAYNTCITILRSKIYFCLLLMIFFMARGFPMQFYSSHCMHFKTILLLTNIVRMYLFIVWVTRWYLTRDNEPKFSNECTNILWGPQRPSEAFRGPQMLPY